MKNYKATKTEILEDGKLLSVSFESIDDPRTHQTHTTTADNWLEVFFLGHEIKKLKTVIEYQRGIIDGLQKERLQNISIAFHKGNL